jgi:sterol desaturase/sphingolipid hydroxylase (fatty acid hydroxylase superfamily)
MSDGAGDARSEVPGGGHRLLVGAATALLLVAAVALRSRLVVGFLVLAAVLIPAERLFTLHPQRVFRRFWASDVVHFWVNNLLTTAGVLVVLFPVAVAFRLRALHPLHAEVGGQPVYLQLPEALAVAELCSYWSHRASHQVPFLWRFHQVHHSISEMDWLAAGRLHPLDQAFRQLCVAFPLVVLGFSKGSFGGVLVFFALQAIFIHANVRFTFGPLRWLIATPEFHHWHHSNVPAAYNTNFSGEFPCLDALFGTLHLPKQSWPDRYGIDRPTPPGYLAQLAMPFTANDQRSSIAT